MAAAVKPMHMEESMTIDMDVCNTANANTEYGAIEIPIEITDDHGRKETEYLELQLNELPPVSVIIEEVLVQYDLTLDHWLRVALAYYKMKQYDVFEEILKTGLSEETSKTGVQSFLHKGTLKDRSLCQNALGAYHLKQASHSSDQRLKERSLHEAMRQFNKVTVVDSANTHAMVGKALIQVFKDEEKRADAHFTQVLRLCETSGDDSPDPMFVPAAMGKAVIFFRKGLYLEALDQYRALLSRSSCCPSTVRLGMGLCFFRLGDMSCARAAFERTLELQPDSADALVGQAVLALNDHDNTDSVERCLVLLKKAYELDRRHASVLVHLADHFFFRMDFEKSQKLALAAHALTEVNAIRGQANYQLGRVYHAQGYFDDATKHYFQATRNDPTFVLPHYGLGQCHLEAHDKHQAIQCFERVLQSEPDNYETLKILGTLYSDSKVTAMLDKARDCFMRVTTLMPKDMEAWIELGRLREVTDPTGALMAYRKAETLWSKNLLSFPDMPPVPAAVYNNIGALEFAVGDMDHAGTAFTLAVRNAKASSEGSDDKVAEAGLVTVHYNMARYHEATGRTHEAVEGYTKIADMYPGYVDAVLRLGCIARAGGRIAEAMAFFKRAIAVQPDCANAFLLMGNLHMAKKQWGPAQQNYERVLALTTHKHDAYARVALGNIWQQTARPDLGAAKCQTYYQRAIDLYRQVLRQDSQNVYAANGVGAVLADRGHTNEARIIFQQVRETTSDVPDVWMNLAHVHATSGNYVKASKLYLQCLSRFFGDNSPHTLTALARAYYIADKYDECKRALVRAAHIAPHDLAIRYNIALAHYQHACYTLSLSSVTLAEADAAVGDAAYAGKVLEFLAAHKSKSYRYDPMQAKLLNKQTNELLRRTKRLQQTTRRAEIEIQQQEEELTARRRALVDERERREADEREKREAAERLLAENRESFLEQTKAKGVLRFEKIPEKEKRKSSGGGRKRRGGDSDDDDDDDRVTSSSSSDSDDADADVTRKSSSKRHRRSEKSNGRSTRAEKMEQRKAAKEAKAKERARKKAAR